MEAELNDNKQQKAPEAEQTQANKKTKITYEEFQKITKDIVDMLRAYEKENEMESVTQAEIVNQLTAKLELVEGVAGTSVERAIETSRKI